MGAWYVAATSYVGWHDVVLGGVRVPRPAAVVARSEVVVGQRYRDRQGTLEGASRFSRGDTLHLPDRVESAAC